MTPFDPHFFQPMAFSEENVRQHFENARRDLRIAQEDRFSEVVFTYAYQALIKAGIALIGKFGMKVRSVPGHHVKILEQLSELLGHEDVMTLGNAMRTKRNVDFYGGGEIITQKEAKEYLRFVEGIVADVERALSE